MYISSFAMQDCIAEVNDTTASSSFEKKTPINPFQQSHHLDLKCRFETFISTFNVSLEQPNKIPTSRRRMMKVKWSKAEGVLHSCLINQLNISYPRFPSHAARHCSLALWRRCSKSSNPSMERCNRFQVLKLLVDRRQDPFRIPIRAFALPFPDRPPIRPCWRACCKKQSRQRPRKDTLSPRFRLPHIRQCDGGWRGILPQLFWHWWI